MRKSHSILRARRKKKSEIIIDNNSNTVNYDP